MAAERSCWKLPLCPAEPIPGGSRMDPPLTSDCDCALEMTYLRGGENVTVTAGEESENVW